MESSNSSSAADGEIVSPAAGIESDVDPATADRLARLRRLSRLLDSAIEIPGTNLKVGLDPLLGLLPVVGDAPATAASAYVVAEAAALGAPRATLARMCLYLLVDAVFGSVPLVGDAFDVLWRANDRNVRLLEARLVDPRGETRDRRVVVALGTAVFVAVLAVGAGAAVTVWWLLRVAGVAGVV
ncbi:DUF4112 domain-containing protein [Halobellus inordinatus]|uniref:DUF4112 domain-containing protein n=1 Tax=Halobellus inordinatus TaxID=1126236 RepID=UPI00210AFA54